MSLILDALRKSDRQRARQASERLREGPGVASPGLRTEWLLVALVSGLVLSAIALFIALWPRLPAAPTGALVGSAAGQSPEIMENEPSRSPVRSLRGELQTPARGAESPAETQTTVPEPVEPAASQRLEDLNATPYTALPDAVRRQLPQLHVDIHAWSEDPNARFVLINLRRYTEGDRLDESLTVRRILPDGVVLDWNGTLFSLPRQ